MGKHSRDDTGDTAGIVMSDIIDVSDKEAGGSGPFSLRSHDFKPFYTGGPDPHATDVMEKFDTGEVEALAAERLRQPLAAERDPAPPPPTRGSWSWFWTGFGLTLLLLVVVVAVYIVSGHSTDCWPRPMS